MFMMALYAYNNTQESYINFKLQESELTKVIYKANESSIFFDKSQIVYLIVKNSDKFFITESEENKQKLQESLFINKEGGKETIKLRSEKLKDCSLKAAKKPITSQQAKTIFT